MADAKENVPEFKKTVDTEAMISRIERGSCFNLTWLFDEYPTYTIRKTILKYWLDHSICVLGWQADWIEARVIDLKKEEGATHSGFWKELLDWYVFDVTAALANRALDFAIGITEMDDFGGVHGFIYRSDVLKIIAGRLDRSPEIYQDIATPSLKLFLESFLVRTYQPDSIINDFTMVDIKRVVRCAIKVEDWQFLPMIELVLCKLANQKRPEKYDFKQEVAITESLAFLKEALRLFREKTKEVKD